MVWFLCIGFKGQEMKLSHTRPRDREEEDREEEDREEEDREEEYREEEEEDKHLEVKVFLRALLKVVGLDLDLAQRLEHLLQL